MEAMITCLQSMFFKKKMINRNMIIVLYELIRIHISNENLFTTFFREEENIITIIMKLDNWQDKLDLLYICLSYAKDYRHIKLLMQPCSNTFQQMVLELRELSNSMFYHYFIITSEISKSYDDFGVSCLLFTILIICLLFISIHSFIDSSY